MSWISIYFYACLKGFWWNIVWSQSIWQCYRRVAIAAHWYGIFDSFCFSGEDYKVPITKVYSNLNPTARKFIILIIFVWIIEIKAQSNKYINTCIGLQYKPASEVFQKHFSTIQTTQTNQLEKLEAAKAASLWLPLVAFGYLWLPLVTFPCLWLPFLALLCLTGA